MNNTEISNPTAQKRGRKAGSKNKLTVELKSQFSELVLHHLERELKNFPIYDPEVRIKVLLGFMKYVMPQANLTEEENEIQNVVYAQLKRHYGLLSNYLSHVDGNKKPNILLQFLKNLSEDQKKEVSSIVKPQVERLKGRYK